MTQVLKSNGLQNYHHKVESLTARSTIEWYQQPRKLENLKTQMVYLSSILFLIIQYGLDDKPISTFFNNMPCSNIIINLEDFITWVCKEL